jgi:hypothetical protein
LAYLAATIHNIGVDIAKITLLFGKENNPIDINCEDLPEDFLSLEFDNNWVPKVKTYSGFVYRYSYNLKRWFFS